MIGSRRLHKSVVDRRTVLFALLSMGVPQLVRGQTQPLRQIGVLSHEATPAERLLRSSLLRLGYKERANIVVHWQFAEMKVDRLPKMAAELVQKRVDVIVTVSDEATVAAMHATTMLPIVMLGGSVPIEIGLVKSLARPGGNVTGTTATAPETVGKLLATLKEAAPATAKVAVLWDPSIAGVRIHSADSERAAKSLGLTLKYFDATSVGEIDGALKRIAASRPDAMYVALDTGLFSRVGDVANFAMEHRLPSIGLRHFFVDAGGLLYYGPNFQEIVDRTASQIDRILRGVKPVDIPVEQPTTFEMVVNLKTASALGLKIPQSVLLRADRLVE